MKTEEQERFGEEDAVATAIGCILIIICYIYYVYTFNIMMIKNVYVS